VYVTAETNNTVSVLDAKTGRLLHTLHVGDNPRTIAFTPDGTHAWVSAEAGGNVTIIDVAKDSVVGQFPIRDGKTKPVRIAFAPDGRVAYVTEGAAASVSVVDVPKRVVIDSIAVGRRPWGIALSPDGRWLYTADGRSNTVSVIDTKARKVVTAIPVGERPNDLLYIP